MWVSEIFGKGFNNRSNEAELIRAKKICPFQNTPCTKSSKTDPIGICTFSDGNSAASVCPNRFLEHGRIFRDAAAIAFGEAAKYEVFPEIKILKIKDKKTGKDKKIGKVDFLIGKIESGSVTDFAAVEIQAVYFSGTEIRTFLKNYLHAKSTNIKAEKRGMDFRSSAQKRLIPQLKLKVPVFRRWGKKFFVVVDSLFFESLPNFNQTVESNSEVTWLSYPIQKSGADYEIQPPHIIFSEWDEIKNALREGVAPSLEEITSELQKRYNKKKNAVL